MSSSSSKSPAKTHLVAVKTDAAQQNLTVEPSRLELTSGDIVIWDFFNLPEGWTPALRFVEDHRQGLGPFAALRQSQGQIWGQGSDGSEQVRTYQAVITPPEDEDTAPLLSGDAKVRIGGPANTSPVVVVTPNLEDGTFEVHPDPVTRLGGDSIAFRFEGLSPNQVPSIQFHAEWLKDSLTPQASQHLGPFNGFRRDVNVIAAEGSNTLLGGFEYNVVVAEMLNGQWQEKKLRRSPDPFVYSEEDPADQPEEPDPRDI